MVSLKPIATNQPAGKVYGGAELSLEFLPDDARQQTLKKVRMAKAVEWIIAEPNPTVSGLVETIGVSRATVYRMLAMPEFQGMLRQQLTARLSMTARKAFATVERTMEDGSPALRLRAATWLLERYDKLCQVAGVAPEPTANAELEVLLGGMELRNTIRRMVRDDELPEEAGEKIIAAASTLLRCDEKRAGDELLDAELSSRSPVRGQ